MDVFPYRYRPGQRELVGFIDGSVRDGMCPVIEAGTGTGKTITSLAGAIPIAREKDLKIVYLTRTKSQQLQVIRECGHIEGTVCAALQGRTAQSCPMMRGDADLRTGTPEEISKLCSEYKRRTENGCACPYFANLEGISVEHWLDVLHRNPEPEAFADVCEKAMICPYELMKHLFPYADVVAASYPFVFAPQILSRFEEWIGTPLERMLIIVDEAHNLPDYLRDIQTYEYSRYSMEMAEKEARKEGDHEIHDGLRITDLASVLREVLDAAAREYLIDEDGIIPPHFVEEELMSRLGATSVALGRMAKGLQDMGDIIEEKLKQKRKLPRSYIGSMGRFLELWMTERDEYGVRLVIGGDNPRFQAYCMDPAPAAEPLNASFSSILMSGTLEPLEDFAKEIGLERPAVRRLGSVFPPGQSADALHGSRLHEIRGQASGGELPSSDRYADRHGELGACEHGRLLSILRFHGSHDGRRSGGPSRQGCVLRTQGDAAGRADGDLRAFQDVRGERPLRRDRWQDKRGAGLPGQVAGAGGDRGDPVPQADGQVQGDGPLLRPQVRRREALGDDRSRIPQDEAIHRPPHKIGDGPRRRRRTRQEGRIDGSGCDALLGHTLGGLRILQQRSQRRP